MTWLVGFLLLSLLLVSHKYAWWARVIPYKHPRVLMYHMISEPVKGTQFNGLRVNPKRFEQQLAWLKAEGWHFVTLSELIKSCEPLPNKTVAITFDDGFEDNYTNAYPLLRKYGAKATLYLVNNRHNNDWSSKKKSHHASGELMAEPKLSNAQVIEMIDSGIFELGAHTLSHANLSVLSGDDKKQEIQQSKADLQTLFNVEITSFAYPFGIYSSEDCDIVSSSGYTSAVTTINGVDTGVERNVFQLKRLKISGKENFYAFKLRLSRGRRGFNK